mmetsp:Transcript_5977/g.15208  ORF Transcript_5977/g.15208 Transcript_5977/m.15208 type:complete len:252 (+) Transcript_5977:84-839(+)
MAAAEETRDGTGPGTAGARRRSVRSTRGTPPCRLAHDDVWERIMEAPQLKKASPSRVFFVRGHGHGDVQGNAGVKGKGDASPQRASHARGPRKRSPAAEASEEEEVFALTRFGRVSKHPTRLDDEREWERVMECPQLASSAPGRSVGFGLGLGELGLGCPPGEPGRKIQPNARSNPPPGSTRASRSHPSPSPGGPSKCPKRASGKPLQRDVLAQVKRAWSSSSGLAGRLGSWARRHHDPHHGFDPGVLPSD